MVINQVLTPKNNQRARQEITILDLELRPTQPFERIERTASGGFKLHSISWDEFDNQSEIIVILEKSDVDAIKEMISQGLI